MSSNPLVNLELSMLRRPTRSDQHGETKSVCGRTSNELQAWRSSCSASKMKKKEKAIVAAPASRQLQ